VKSRRKGNKLDGKKEREGGRKEKKLVTQKAGKRKAKKREKGKGKREKGRGGKGREEE